MAIGWAIYNEPKPAPATWCRDAFFFEIQEKRRKKRQKNERFKICETKKSFGIFCNSMSPTVTHYSITILVCLYQSVQNIEKKSKK